jgi:hypothetical protein
MSKRALSSALHGLGPGACAEVDVARMGLNDDVARRLAKALETASGTTALDLSGNPGISDSGARALLEALSKNKTLLRLDLRGSASGSSNRAQIEAKLRQRAITAARDALLLRWLSPRHCFALSSCIV